MKTAILSAALVGVTFSGVPLFAGSHLWGIEEIFSNADGTIQFIELRECCGARNEIYLKDKWMLSATTSNQFTFPEDLPPDSTANRYLLLATTAFAALPGAPAPDYILPENFFDRNEDTIRYYLYGNVTLSFGPGELPLDGIRSLGQDEVTAINSPTNFAGIAGTINVSGTKPSFVRGDVDGDGAVNGIVDALFLLNFGFVPGSLAPACQDAADADDDGIVNALTDSLYSLTSAFVPGSPSLSPPFPDCGFDPTRDALGCNPVPGCL